MPPNTGMTTVEASMYAENTHGYRTTPPSVLTTVGMAVPTIVASRAARRTPSWTATTTGHTRAGEASTSARV